MESLPANARERKSNMGNLKWFEETFFEGVLIKVMMK